MTLSSTAMLLGLLAISTAAFGCMPQTRARPPAAAAALPPRVVEPRERHVYRFDFVLTTHDASGGPSSTAFTLNLQEDDKGEVIVGNHGAPAVARRDVSTKVGAVYRALGDDVLLEVMTEVSTFDPPSSAMRKMVTRGNALASSGHPALVSTLADEQTRYQLTVTPTKLR